MNIVQVATKNTTFSKLVSAITAAGLVDALSADGPFTVFAPNDAAFAKLPAGALDTLLKPENKDKLVALLKMHVVPGKHMAAEYLGKDSEATTLGGDKIAIKSKNGRLTVEGADVGSSDVGASNGVIHVIDTVLTPALAPA
jgi:uncharacterized surface protein with fasciclin (FAS1) repeats